MSVKTVKLTKTVKEWSGVKQELDSIKNRLASTASKMLNGKEPQIIHVAHEFSYNLSKITKKLDSMNRGIAEPFRRSMTEARDKLKGKEYEQKRRDVLNKTAKIGDNGQPIMTYDQVAQEQIPQVAEDMIEDRDKKLEALEKKYKDYLDRTEELQEKYSEALGEDEIMEFKVFEASCLPDLLPHEMDYLLDFLEENGEDTSSTKE